MSVGIGREQYGSVGTSTRTRSHSSVAVTVGAIGTACALGYLDFRKQVDWRHRNPELIGWLDAFESAVPAFNETLPDS